MIRPKNLSFINTALVTTSGTDEEKYGTIELHGNEDEILECGVTDDNQEYMLIYPTNKSFLISLKTIDKMIEHTRTYIKNQSAP